MLLDENRRVRNSTPPAFVHLMSPLIEKLDETLQPGATTLTWSSVNIDKFINSVYKALREVEIIVNHVRNVTEFRIEAILRDIANTVLCQFPEEEPWSPDRFLKHTEVSSA